MMAHEDIHFELIDLPAISTEHAVPWIASTLQTVDACMLVVDLSDASCVDEVESVHAVLREKRVTLSERWHAVADEPVAQEDDAAGDPFALRFPTLLLANKADQIPDIASELTAFRELTGLRYPALAVSASTGRGLDELGPWLFHHLDIVRVYTKAPGHAPDRNRPFTLRRGRKVEDIAQLVHPDVARALRYARVWGKSGFDGQQVGREHVLADGDVVELHA